MSPRRSLSLQRAMFLVLSTRRSSQEGQLSRDLLCAAEDEQPGDAGVGDFDGSTLLPGQLSGQDYRSVEK